MSNQHPRCPQCHGLLKHEPADILGAERVKCILCSWELVRPTGPTQNREENTLKPELDWITKALSVKTLIKITVPKRSATMATTNNTLSDLNDHLFTQLGRLSNAKDDKLKEEIERTRAMSMLSNSMIENAKLALEVKRCLGGKTDTPSMLLLEASK